MAKKKKTTIKKSQKIDKAAHEVIEEFKTIPKKALTAGSLQASFHQKERENSKAQYTGSFPIVAVGASAGGLESYTELLQNLPDDTGMSFVFIQHLAAEHESLLPPILSRISSMEVIRAESDMKAEPNKVDVIPPNTNIGIVNGVLKLLPRIEGPGRHMPIDFFLRCLSDDQAHLAIAVILSGADSDGSQGIRAIRAQGGIVIVQDPKTAKVPGMPTNAIASGASDKVLSLSEIGQELVRLGLHPYSRGEADHKTPAQEISEVFAILKSKVGVDFTKYKQGTMLRRLRRRVLLRRVKSVGEYSKILLSESEEIRALHRDLLINVTSFFRDANVFEYLQNQIFPKLFDKSLKNGVLRFWIPGCSTGEEVYSIAIALLESMERRSISIPFQIFASDLSEHALEKARTGFYDDSITVDVSPERLRRFFTKVPKGYRVVPNIRDACIFAHQDITRDPPFSRMDLISCRNLMIYLESTQQQRVLSLFSYSLNPLGYLLLGAAETTSGHESFETVEKNAKVYMRKATVPRSHLEMQLAPNFPKLPLTRTAEKISDPAGELEREVHRLLVNRYAPPGVVVSQSMQIILFRGSTGAFLEPSSGEASLNLLKMAKAGLDTELRVLIKKFEKMGEAVRKENLFIREVSDKKFSIEILPLTYGDEGRYMLILFDDQSASAEVSDVVSASAFSPNANQLEEIKYLKEELVTNREHLQSIIRDQDVTNEELQAANEEVLSSNEELQSTNEEMETAKEELQSTNEELTTVNDELSVRNALLQDLNNDLSNLLSSVSIPIVMVGNDLRIRRFTPMVERVFNVIQSDIGRPITDIKPNIDVPDLENLILETIESVRTIEREVQDRSGHWYSLRVRPYRTIDNRIDGAVLILVDIGSLKSTVEDLKDSHSFNETIVDTITQPVVFLDSQMRVRKCNRAYLRAFQVKEDEVIKGSFFEISDGCWNSPMLKALLSDVIPKNAHITDYQYDHEFPKVGRRSVILNARRIQRDGAVNLMLILDDVTTDG